MRRTPVALLALAAGLAAAGAIRRFAGRRRSRALVASPDTAVGFEPSLDPAADAVVLPFSRRPAVQRVAPPAVEPTTSAPVQTPARCGNTGGLTKAGAPCAARATSAGRCHHHRAAA